VHADVLAAYDERPLLGGGVPVGAVRVPASLLA
jgi:hypothetical protein